MLTSKKFSTFVKNLLFFKNISVIIYLYCTISVYCCWFIISGNFYYMKG